MIYEEIHIESCCLPDGRLFLNCLFVDATCHAVIRALSLIFGLSFKLFISLESIHIHPNERGHYFIMPTLLCRILDKELMQVIFLGRQTRHDVKRHFGSIIWVRFCIGISQTGAFECPFLLDLVRTD